MKNYIDTAIAGYLTEVQADNLLNNKLDSLIINYHYSIIQNSNSYVSKATFDANIC